MSRLKTFTDAQEKRIVTAYKGGKSSIQIAERQGVSTNVILRTLRSNRVKIRPRGRYKGG